MNDLSYRAIARSLWSLRGAPPAQIEPTHSAVRYHVRTVLPLLLLHGSNDGLVPVEQARQLAAEREGLGLSTRLVIYEGAPHGFFNTPSPTADVGVRELIDHVSAHRS